MLTSFRKNFRVTYLKLSHSDTATVYRNTKWAMMKFRAGELPRARYSTKITFYQRVPGNGVDLSNLRVRWERLDVLEKKRENQVARVSLSHVFRTLQSMVKVSPTIFSRTLFRRHQASPTIPSDVHRLLPVRNFSFVTFRR